MKRRKIRWSKNLAYVVGLIVTDGNLSKDNRHIELTSKDLEQIENFVKILNITNNNISYKRSSYNPQGVYYRIQFSDANLYRFLQRTGLFPNKTKTVGSLKIPDQYFIDFLRGHLDGDGCTTSLWDCAFKNSFRLYTSFISASKLHLIWLKGEIERLYGVRGTIFFGEKTKIYNLKFAKRSSLVLLNKIYYKENVICLKRKYLKIQSALGIIAQQAGVGKLVNPLP